MNYNTLCLKLSSCLHSSTLTSLSTILFTFLSASLLHASLPPRLPSQPPLPPSFFVVHFPPPLLLDLSLFLFTSFFTLTPSISIHISSFHSLSLQPPLLLFTPSVLASPPPLPLLPCSISSQTHSPGSPLYCLGRLESHCFL